MSRLLTLVQISDLHIGAIDPTTGDAPVSSAAAALFASTSYLDGVLGHHARGLQDLAAFVKTMDASGEPWRVVVSGDLTQYGDGVQFDNAAEFLAASLDINPPTGNFVGLNRGAWLPLAIPGNHDQWSGSPVVFGGPHPRLAAFFPPKRLPRITNLPLGNGRTLRMIGIDTDADVSPWGPSRLRAIGSFQKQLAAAAPMLGASGPDEIRVLLMHHSWDYRGRTLKIDRATRGALGAFLVAHGIRLVLTGHTHESLVQPFDPVPATPSAPNVLECRSGSTTQIDRPPYTWRTLFNAFPTTRWKSNTLLVHRLTDQGGPVLWEVDTYARTPAGGFRPLAPGSGVRGSIVV